MALSRMQLVLELENLWGIVQQIQEAPLDDLKVALESMPDAARGGEDPKLVGIDARMVESMMELLNRVVAQSRRGRVSA